MNCQEIQKNLSSYVDGVLSSEEKKLVEGHLTSCGQCSAALADLRKAKDLLRNLDEVEPPPWLTAKIMARVGEEKEQRASFLKKLFFPFYIKVPIQALTVILVGVIVFQVYRMVEPEKKVTHAPSPPSLLTEQEALKKETPSGAAKSSEALSPQPQRNTAASKIAEKKDENAQPMSYAQGREDKKPGNVPVPAGENAPVMAEATPEDKSKKEAAGLANVPVQTEASRQRFPEGQPEDSEKAAVFADKKGVEEEPETTVLKDKITRQRACAQLMPCIIVSVSDTAAAKKVAEDMVKQLDGKAIETITQGTREIIIAELPSENINELSEKLQTLGEIKTNPELSKLPEETVRVHIEITPR